MTIHHQQQQESTMIDVSMIQQIDDDSSSVASHKLNVKGENSVDKEELIDVLRDERIISYGSSLSSLSDDDSSVLGNNNVIQTLPIVVYLHHNDNVVDDDINNGVNSDVHHYHHYHHCHYRLYCQDNSRPQQNIGFPRFLRSSMRVYAEKLAIENIEESVS
mmetsp:Transcript_42312/g.54468  ORF Transcript_42312/g.54468 Transcript_42312/m.54468 type:complete len:161 (-) Transcript_42312:55-537(-)